MKKKLCTVVYSTVVAVSMLIPVVTSSPADAFGTINDGKGGGQNAEHGKITRRALTCTSSSPNGTCFEKKTLQSLSGSPGNFGAVGAPDVLLNFKSEAHCSAGDYFATPNYPQSQEDAKRKLEGCRTHMLDHLNAAVASANHLLNEAGALQERQIPKFTNLRNGCNYLKGTRWPKCNVLAHFGILLHAAQDFYSHSNWVDQPDETREISPDNPPGLNNANRADWLDLRKSQPAFPAGLISGCFETGSFVSEDHFCLAPYNNGTKGFRVRHKYLNKDLGIIDPAIGEAGTIRGKIHDNFARAVKAAIEDTVDKWSTLRERLIQTYGQERGAIMNCALTHDDPMRDCRGLRPGTLGH